MKLVYQLQLLSDGTLWKYKVRYIVRGFSFIFNRDYFATYAPVTQITSIKLFLIVCLYYNLPYFTIDVKAAYLNSTLDVDIWCKMPEDKLY